MTSYNNNNNNKNNYNTTATTTTTNCKTDTAGAASTKLQSSTTPKRIPVENYENQVRRYIDQNLKQLKRELLASRVSKGMWRSSNGNGKGGIRKEMEDKMVAESIVRLNSRIAESNFVKIPAPMDGNCLFFSLAYQLFGDGSRHPLLRKQAVDSMRTDPSMREFYVGNWDKHCAEMSQSGFLETTSSSWHSLVSTN